MHKQNRHDAQHGDSDDNRDDVELRLPRGPLATNGRRIALVGAGCASLTVANDLAPLGYECVIFEALDRPGGLMRTNIPAFRLPAEVLDEEIGYILQMGVELRLSSPVQSMLEADGGAFITFALVTGRVG